MAALDFEVHLDIDELIEMLKEQGWRPEKHGRWKMTRTAWRYCSMCGCEPPCETNYATAYCPNCGAKMDGENDEID